jgi:DNA modification methylase
MLTRHTTHISLRNVQPEPLPPEFTGPDIRLPPELARDVNEQYTQPGGVILDPFAGFGTIPAVAEQLGRVGYGIEVDRQRATYARAQLRTPEHLLIGDARQIDALGLPPVDLVFSSPPYMQRADAVNPLSGEAGSYEEYVDELAGIYVHAASLLRDGGHLVIEVANLKRDGVVTTLAWDLGLRVGRSLVFEGETVVTWDRYGYGYDHSYCLAYGK